MSEAPVLVTGASGFLGRHVLESLSSWGFTSLALVRDVAAWHRMEWTASLPAVAPVTKDDELPPRLAGLIHLAALVRHSRKNPEEVYQTNVEGTLRMIRLAADRQCRVVYSSTSGVVGCFRTPDRSADEHAPFALDEISGWPYYHSKAIAEQRARELATELKVELVIVRPPVLLGPGDHRFRSTGNIIRYLRGRLPFLVQGGMHFADVRDVAEAIVQAMLRPHPQPVYNLTGTICSIREFFQLAERVSGVRAPRGTLPPAAARLLAGWLAPLHVLPDPVVVEMATRHWATSSLYAESELGYTSRDPEETMRDTIEWLKANNAAIAAALT